LQLFIILGIIVVLNVLSGYFFARFDLTTEKRYTRLLQHPKTCLKGLDDVVYVKGVSGWRTSQQVSADCATAHAKPWMNFVLMSGNRIEYQFINPTDQPNEQEPQRPLSPVGQRRHRANQHSDKGKRWGRAEAHFSWGVAHLQRPSGAFTAAEKPNGGSARANAQ
jgi:hypothetical protein